MTAATHSRCARTRDSQASRRALRLARIRGVIVAALGVVALGAASTTFANTATFSFWIDKQGGKAVTI